MINKGNVKVFQRFVVATIFKLVRLAFVTIQRIFWELNGTAKKLRESRDPRNYERSAHVVDVIASHTFCELNSMAISDFICTHNRFDSPQFILDNDHINLMNITDTDAVFCEAKDKNIMQWRSEVNAFMRFGQMANRKRLIFVPLEAFHRLSEKVGDPKGELIFLFNTARCGSTLINQVMEATGRVVAISEPLCPDRIVNMYQTRGDSPQLRQLTRDVIRLECRPYKSLHPEPLAYMMKLVAPSGVGLPFFRELFPKSRLLFMYRDITKTAMSFYRLSYMIPSVCMINNLGCLSGKLTSMAMDAIGFHGKEFGYRIENDLTFGVLLSAVTMKAYLDMRHKGVPIQAVRYEQLVGKPLETCRKLMEYCGLPVDLAERAVTGLEHDSQRNTPGDRRVWSKLPEARMTEEKKQSLNRMLRKFDGIPQIGDVEILEGTFDIDV